MNMWWGRRNFTYHGRPLPVGRALLPDILLDNPNNPLRSIMQKRSPSSRRRNIRRKNGSIMIMVVALLVLMALIGTAYIATARIDRGSATQNADNVQIDLLVNSVLNMCKTSVAGDCFDGN